MTDPYKVLGISPDATDDQVKAAYREMARKYHPDNYADNPLSDLAKEKMQEINEAYDSIVRQRKSGGGYGGSRGSGRYADIRSLISQNRIQDAETLLDGIPSVSRDAVPLPMAMCTTPCFLISPERMRIASSFFASLNVG